MPTSISCPTCQKQLKVPDGAKGRKAKCGKCGAPIVVPQADYVKEPESDESTSASPKTSANDARRTRIAAIPVLGFSCVVVIAFMVKVYRDDQEAARLKQEKAAAAEELQRKLADDVERSRQKRLEDAEASFTGVAREAFSKFKKALLDKQGKVIVRDVEAKYNPEIKVSVNDDYLKFVKGGASLGEPVTGTLKFKVSTEASMLSGRIHLYSSVQWAIVHFDYRDGSWKQGDATSEVVSEWRRTPDDTAEQRARDDTKRMKDELNLLDDLFHGRP